MWTRSEAAFRFSAIRLFDLYHPVYFWTFTFAKVMPDWFYSNVWSRFSRDLCDLYGGTLHGLKVIELHVDHGLHYHALVNKRIWSGEVWRIARRYGIGWLSVKKADEGSIDYLSKYLTKQWKSDNKFFAKCSRWGTMGGFRGCRCSDVEIDSPLHRAIKICQTALGEKKLPFLLVRFLGVWETEDPALLLPAMERYRKSGSISGLLGGKLGPSRPDVERFLRALKR